MHPRRVYLALLALVSVAAAPLSAQPQSAPAPYPEMAALDKYLMPEADEIAFAKTAAPAAITDQAEVMVLGKDGYHVAVKGTNGFTCIVERSWANTTDHPEFWNPKLRAPICFNQASLKNVLALYLLKTKLVLEGKPKADIVKAVAAEIDQGRVPPIETGAMCFMMSKDQYLSDDGIHWHPHMMFFLAGDAAKTWGADLKFSPVISAYDPEERCTTMMVVVRRWSDGSMPEMAGH